MTTADAILADILKHPDDDALRLIYADCIEDSQPERAEFIRVQVELAKCEQAHECNKLRQRERHLLWLHENTWRERCYPLSARTWLDPGTEEWVIVIKWSRGFVEGVMLASNDWLASADYLTVSHPIRKVDLTAPLSDLPNPPYPTPQDMFGGLIFNFDLFQHGSAMSRVPPEIVEQEGHLGARWYATIRVLSKMWPNITFCRFT